MSGLLMDERFVAVFPSLVRLLGSLESAVILQHIHWAADEEGWCRITRQQISDETGITFATVTRRLSSLRDGGWLESRRASKSDSTQVYRVVTEQIRGSDSRESQSATVGSRNLASSESRSLRLSSLQKGEVPSGVVPEVATARESADLSALRGTPVPERHSSRPMAPDWLPSPLWTSYLATRYRHVAIAEVVTRFRAYNYANQSTSKSWEALLETWCSRDEEAIVRGLFEGTDELGIPVTQGGVSIVPPPLQPGDDGYFNPLED